ncbi:MAG: hypothetical protein QM724_09240 [Flavobacteriales bacterium]
MQHFLATLAVMATFATVQAQTAFPRIEGETTANTTVELPTASKGKYAIIAVAYGTKAEPLLAEWYEPAYLRFVNKHGLFAGTYEADLWFVPVFVGLNKAAYEPSMKKLRKGSDPDVAKRVVFFKGDADLVITALGLKNKDVPYFFVVDADGRIVHRTQGAFSVDKLDAIEEVLLQ